MDARSSSDSSSSDPREIMQSELGRLPFATYLLVVRLMLQRAGYRYVRSLGRNFLKGGGRRGGADLLAVFPTPQGLVKVLVQVKQESRDLQRRYVDELRGKLLRENISHGLIITLGNISKAASKATREFEGRPVSLIDGFELARLIQEMGAGQSNKFFDAISQVRFATQRPLENNEAIRRAKDKNCESLPKLFQLPEPGARILSTHSLPTNLTLVALGIVLGQLVSIIYLFLLWR